MGNAIGGLSFLQRPGIRMYGNGSLPVQFNSPRRTMPGGPIMPRLPQNPYAQFARNLARNLAPPATKLPPAFFGE